MTLPADYIEAARLRANRFMACWDAGTSGALAADVRRLMWEREELMQQIEAMRTPTKPRVIGFAGHAGSGKSTASQSIGGISIGFADPLYAGLAAMLGVTEQQLRDRTTKELPGSCGRSPRDLLRTLGTEWGRELVRDDLWIWRARQRVAEAAQLGPRVIAFADVRFQNEAAFIREELGGQVWWIDRPDTCPGGHVSDLSLTRDDADLVIANTGSVEQLRWAVHLAAEG